MSADIIHQSIAIPEDTTFLHNNLCDDYLFLELSAWVRSWVPCEEGWSHKEVGGDKMKELEGSGKRFKIMEWINSSSIWKSGLKLNKYKYCSVFH